MISSGPKLYGWLAEHEGNPVTLHWEALAATPGRSTASTVQWSDIFPVMRCPAKTQHPRWNAVVQNAPPESNQHFSPHFLFSSANWHLWRKLFSVCGLVFLANTLFFLEDSALCLSFLIAYLEFKLLLHFGILGFCFQKGGVCPFSAFCSTGCRVIWSLSLSHSALFCYR